MPTIVLANLDHLATSDTIEAKFAEYDLHPHAVILVGGGPNYESLNVGFALFKNDPKGAARAVDMLNVAQIDEDSEMTRLVGIGPPSDRYGFISQVYEFRDKLTEVDETLVGKSRTLGWRRWLCW